MNSSSSARQRGMSPPAPQRGEMSLRARGKNWGTQPNSPLWGVRGAFTEADFQDYFYDDGGLLAARNLFGRETLPVLLDELNETLVV